MIKIGNWSELEKDASFIRFTVFVDEQKFSKETEVTEIDKESDHVVYYLNNKPVGTGRLLPDAHIGRMCVLKEYRGLGIGSIILKTLIQIAKNKNYKQVYLDSQNHAIDFYKKHGFIIIGESHRRDHVIMKMEF